MESSSLDGERYDVIIIGAGVGGLVCGNFLAKAGLKVLVIEQHYKVGGYCTSFSRGPYIFDAGVHEIVQCGEDKVLGKIIRELKVDKKIRIKRFKEADIIVTDGCEIVLRNDYKDTMRQLAYQFPREKDRIKDFFALFEKPIFFSLYSKLNKRSFKELLDEYFLNDKLKGFWYAMCCEMGLTPSNLAAITGFAFCKAFIMDCGYYPVGGMQVFSDALLNTFKDYGGNIILSKRVTKINIINQYITSVRLSTGLKFYTNYVVSTCDPFQTFFKMIGKEYLDQKFINRIYHLQPSPSCFIVFLGLNRALGKDVRRCFAIVYIPEYSAESKNDVNDHFDPYSKNMIFVPLSFNDPGLAPEDGESIYLLKIVPYKSKKYWDENKFSLAEKLIDDAEVFIPNFRRYIRHREIATPQTLYKYTLNYRGASRGWGGFSATGLNMLDFISPIKNLFMAGHWAPSPVGNGGIAMSAYSGFQTANQIKNMFRKII